MAESKTILSPLATAVLADHQRAPQTFFYDLLSLGTFFDTGAIAQLDAAYSELEQAGLLERADGQFVRFAGQTRPMFRLRPAATGNGRRKSA